MKTELKRIVRRVSIAFGALLFAFVAATGEEAASPLAETLPQSVYSDSDRQGSVTRIEYPSRDYAGDGSELTKHAIIYLPYGYGEDPDARYDLIVLCHGIGGTESEWGFDKLSCVAKKSLDQLIAGGAVRPVIVVCPNGRSTADCYNTSFTNAASFYFFGQELRNDLLPYIDENYLTYGSDAPGDLAASRDHRAMAGLSMGGMQTINIGLCECLDLFSAYGAFSAAPTSYSRSEIAAKLNAFPDYDIRLFYSVCGKQDGIAYASSSLAAKGLDEKTDKLDAATNFYYQEVNGGHDFNVWNLGFYNFLRLLG